MKKCQKSGPTHVETEFSFFSQDFFGKVKNGHLFCPFFEKAESSRPKNLLSLLKKILPSQTKKKILICYDKFFLYFLKKGLGNFSVSILWQKILTKKFPKFPHNFIAKNVITNVVKSHYGTNIVSHQNIIILTYAYQILTKKFPKFITVIVVKNISRNVIIDKNVIVKDTT
jgi:hypothetical protein